MATPVVIINESGRRISFTEISGLKFVDEVHNKNLVESYSAILISKRKVENKGVEPPVFKGKGDAVAAIESNQRKAMEMIQDCEILVYKRKKLIVEVDQMELQKTNYLMDKCLQYAETKYSAHWEKLLENHLAKSSDNDGYVSTEHVVDITSEAQENENDDNNHSES